MKSHLLLLCALVAVGRCAADEPTGATVDVKENGVFGFPQKQATVLWDRPDLRFSVWNNDAYFFAQAVLWTDDDGSLGKTEDNREIGDWSVLAVDMNPNRKSAFKMGRDYALNPWPGDEGLHYQV